MTKPVFFSRFYRLLPMLLLVSVLTIPLALISLEPRAAHSTKSLANTDEMKVISHLGKNYSISSVAIQGDYAYISANPELGEQSGLAVLNMSNPTAPQEVAFLALSAPVEEVFVAGNYAFARTTHDIRIIDISSPLTPLEIGQLTGEKVEAVERNDVYVVESAGMLRIWDISDATSPVDVGSYAYSGKDIEVANSHLYVLEDSGVRIINLSNPASPTEMVFFETEGRQLAIKDDYLLISGGDCQYQYPNEIYSYCTSCQGTLKVVDISNSANPLLVYENQRQGLIEGISVQDNYALLDIYHCYSVYHEEFEYYGYEVVDISDPQSPTESQIVRNFESVLPDDGTVRGNYLYLADRTKGMSIWQVSAESVEQVSSYGTQAPIRDVAVADGYAYIVGEQYKLQVVDLLTHSEPTRLATLAGNAIKILVKKGYAYIAQDSNLHIIDISNPTMPIEVGVYSYSGYGRIIDMVITNQIAILTYSGSYSGTFHLVDILDPTNPTLITSVPNPIDYSGYEEVKGLAVAGDYAYVVWDFNHPRLGGNDGLAIVDISNPAAPILVARHDDLAVDPGIVIKDNYAYVGKQGKMNVLDLSQSMTPTLVASHAVSGVIEDITIQGDHAYLAMKNGQVALFNISNPTAPNMITFYDTPEHARGIDVADGYIYVADDNWGLIALQYASRITGRVSQANGLPFPHVAISSTGGLTTTTNNQGHYVFGERLTGTYTITPAHSGYRFSPATQTVSVPSDAQANFTILPAPVSTTLSAGISTTLTITDTQGAPTRIDVPSNAVTTTATIFLTPTVENNQIGSQFAGHAFELGVSPQSESTFNAPVPITIHYTDADTHLILDLNELTLWWWQDGQWQDAAQSCNPASTYEHDTDAQTITVAICQTGRFALFGPTNRLFLPVMTSREQ